MSICEFHAGFAVHFGINSPMPFTYYSTSVDHFCVFICLVLPPTLLILSLASNSLGLFRPCLSADLTVIRLSLRDRPILFSDSYVSLRLNLISNEKLQFGFCCTFMTFMSITCSIGSDVFCPPFTLVSYIPTSYLSF